MKGSVSSKGQVTIPKRLRDRFGIRTGTVVDFKEEGGRLILCKADPRDPVGAVYGILRGAGRTDEIMAQLRGEPDAT